MARAQRKEKNASELLIFGNPKKISRSKLRAIEQRFYDLADRETAARKAKSPEYDSIQEQAHKALEEMERARRIYEATRHLGNPAGGFYISAVPRNGGRTEEQGFYQTREAAKKAGAERFPLSSYFKFHIRQKRQKTPAQPRSSAGPFSRFLGNPGNNPASSDTNEIRKEIRELKSFMKQNHIPTKSVFNAGHTPESYRANARLFELKTKLSTAKRSNPRGGIGNRKPGCKCAFCQRARDVAKRVGKMPKPIRAVFDRNPRRRNSFLEEVRKGSYIAKITANQPEGPYSVRLYVNGGETITGTHSKAQTLAGARKQAQKMVSASSNPKRKRRNPELAGTKQAVRLFETFHGKDAQEVVEKQVSAAMRMDYTALGDLIALGLGECAKHGNALVNGWDACNNLTFDGDGVKLASSPEGRQLYLIGGNQNLDKALANWEGIDPEKDLIDLGECSFVVYEARKAHSNFEPVEWVHEFGEGSRSVPRILYDRIKRQVFLTGGEYFIDASKELSPGIEG